ncbi:MAG: nucleoside triphosphate pyrophosphohydrolase [Leptospirales bacterium]
MCSGTGPFYTDSMPNQKNSPSPSEVLSTVERLGTPVPRTFTEEDGAGLLRLLEIIDHLRGENGCSFDKTQTVEALLRDLKDELYELSEAVESGQPLQTSREIGDLVLILLFMRRILWEKDQTRLSDILDHVSTKMVRRHPHVFLEPNLSIDSKTIWERWEKEKRQEEEHRDRLSILDGIPRTMPALEVAFKQGQKAGRVGFDWTDEDAVWEKVIEEIGELSEARFEGPERLDHEIGDLLLAVSSYARHAGIRPEEALERANHRFDQRFRSMETRASESGQSLASLTPEQWNELWEEAKRLEQAGSKKDSFS